MANSLVNEYRKRLASQGKATDKTDRELTVMLGNALRRKGDFETEKRYPDFREEYLNYTQATGRGAGAEFAAGLDRGWEGLKSTAVGAAALGLDLVGADQAAGKLAKSAKEMTGEAEAPSIARMEDIQDVGDALRYVVGKAGEVTPSLAEALVTSAAGAIIGGSATGGAGAIPGAVGGLVGKQAIKQLIKSGVAKQLLKREVTEDVVEQALKERADAALEGAFRTQVRNMVSRYSGSAASAVNSAALSTGEIYNETGDAGTALKFGAVAALPDTVLPSIVLRRFFPNVTAATEPQVRGFVGRLLTEAAKTVPVESGTEAFQQLVNIAARKYHAGEPANLTARDFEEIREAAASGAIGGGIAAPVSALPSADVVTSSRRHPDPLAEARRRAAESVASATQSGAAPRTVQDVRREALAMTEDEQLLRIAALDKLSTRNDVEQFELAFLRALNAGKPGLAPAAPAAPAQPAAPATEAAPAASTPAAQPVPPGVQPVAPTAAPAPPKLSAAVIRQRIQNVTSRLVAVAPHVDTKDVLAQLDAITAAGTFSADSLAAVEAEVQRLEQESVNAAARQARAKVQDAADRAQAKKLVAKRRAEKQLNALDSQLAKLESVEQPTLSGVSGVSPKPAPAVYLGEQDAPGGTSFPVYRLTEDIPGHPKDSAVSRETLEKAGFTAPAAPAEAPAPITFGRLAAAPFDYRETVGALTPEQIQSANWQDLISKGIEDSWRTDKSNASQTRVGMAFLNPATGEVFLRGVYVAKNMGGVVSVTGAKRQGVAVQDAGRGNKTRTVSLADGKQPALLDDVVKAGGLVPIARVQFENPGRINQNFPSAEAFFASAGATEIAAMRADKRDAKIETEAAADVAKLNEAKTEQERQALARAMIRKQRNRDKTSPPSGDAPVTYGDGAVAAAEAQEVTGGGRQRPNIHTSESGEYAAGPAEEVVKVRKFGSGPWQVRVRATKGKWAVMETVPATASDKEVQDAYSKALAATASGYVQIVDAEGTAHGTVQKKRTAAKKEVPVTVAEMMAAAKLLNEGGWLKTLEKVTSGKTEAQVRAVLTDFLYSEGRYKGVLDGVNYRQITKRAYTVLKATLANHARLAEAQGESKGAARADGSTGSERGNRRVVPADAGGTSARGRGKGPGRKAAAGAGDSGSGAGGRGRAGVRPDAGRAGSPELAAKLAQLFRSPKAVAGLAKLHDFIVSGSGRFDASTFASMPEAQRESLLDLIARLGADWDEFAAHIQAAIEAARGDGDAFAEIVRGADPKVAAGVNAPGFLGFRVGEDGLVSEIYPGSPAEIAGLRVGDKVTKFTGTGQQGRRFTVTVERDGRRHVVIGVASNPFEAVGVTSEYRKRSLNDVLDALEADGKLSVYEAALARALRSLGLETTMVYGYGKASLGRYRLSADTIKIFGENIANANYSQLVLHEALHAATLAGLITNNQFFTEIESIRMEVMAWVDANRPKLAAIVQRAGAESWNTTGSAILDSKDKELAYFLGSPEEFIAGLAEPSFVQFLKGIEVSSAKKVTVFQRLMNLIWKFFGGHGFAKREFVDLFTREERLAPKSAHTALLASTLSYLDSGQVKDDRRTAFDRIQAEAARHTRIGGAPLDGFFDPLDGKIAFREALPDTPEAALWNLEVNAPVMSADAPVKADAPAKAEEMSYTEAMARVQSGAWNELIPLIAQLKKDLMPNATDIEFWKVFARGQLPTDILAAIEKRVPGSSSAAIGGDKMTDAMNQRARYQAFFLAQTGAVVARRRLASSLETTERVSDELIELAEELNKAERHYMDANAVNIAMVEKLRDLVRELARDMDRAVTSSTNLGKLTAAIKEVEGLLDDQGIPEDYQRVLKQVMDSDGVRVLDQLSAIANLNLPLGSMKVNEVMAALQQNATDPRIAALLSSRPLAVALVTLARNSVREMDLMQLRVMRDRAQAMAIRAELDEIRTASDARLEELAKTITANGESAALRERLRMAYISVRRSVRSKQRVLERAALRQRVLSRVSEALQEKARELSRDVGAFSYWEPRDGANYWAMQRNADGKWVKVTRKLVMTGPDITAQHKQVANDMALNRLWLEQHKADAGTRVYEEVKRQTQEISLIDVSRRYHAAQRFWLDKVLSPIGQKFAQMGGAAGKRIQQMFIRFQFITKTHGDEVEASARAWTRALEAASKAAGYAFHRQFFQEVYDPVIYEIESQPGLEEEAALRAAVRAARRRIPEGQKVSEDFVEKLKELLRKTKATSELMLRVAEQHGVYVADRRMKDPLTKKDFLQRHAIKYGWMTVPRRLRPEVIETLLTDMRAVGWRKGMFDAGPEALDAAAIAPFFTPTIIRNFVEPFVFKPGAEVFFGAKGANGEHTAVSQLQAQDAWSRAGGDVLSFADELFAQTFEPRANVDPEVAKQEFRRDLLNRFADLYGMEEAIARKAKPASSLFERMAGANPKPHRLMDGRHNDLIPPEHFQYETFDPTSARVALAEVAFHAAFGRDGRGLDEMLTALTGDLEERARQYKTLPAGSRRVKKIAAEAAGLNFEDIERAWKDHERVKGLAREVGTFFDKGNSTGAVGDERAGLELIQLNAALVLNQPKSGLWNLMSLADFPIVLGGGSMGVRGSVLAAANLMKGVLGSALEAVNINILRSTDYMKEVSSVIEGAQTQQLQFGEFIADIGKAGQFQEGGGNRVVQASRAFQQVMRRGIKLSDKKEFAHFNGLWAPFQFLSHQAATAIATANVQNFELLIKRAMKFFEMNPDARSDPAFRLTAKDLGMAGPAYFTDERAFEFYRERAIEYRVGNIEDIARQAMERTEARILTRDQVLGVTMMALNEISLESSVNSRPIEWFNNPILRYGGLLLGWPLAKMHQVNQSLKTPDGRKELAAAMRGLGVMAAWSLPIAMAYSLMMDEYDEEIIGKKSNLRGIDPVAALPVVGPALALAGTGAKSGWDNFFGMMERFARAGGYGLMGDFANSLTNVVDGTAGQRDFSLDTRILAFSQFANLRDAIRNWIHQDFAMTYETVGRPLLMMLGGNGVLQAQQTINSALELENSERWVTERINVGNWLRAAGREVGLELKVGAGRSLPTPISVWMRQMYLAALSNDRLGFLAAYRNAVTAARKQGAEDPEESVLASWRSRNPLASVFRAKPTESEVAKLLSVMDEDGRQAVREALRLYEQFSEMIEPTLGERLMNRVQSQVARAARPVSIEDLRRRAASF